MINANWQWSHDIRDEVIREVTGLYPTIHICSGASNLGDIRLDRYFDTTKAFIDEPGTPNLRGDMCYLPIKSGIAEAVICDPPYSWLRFSKFFKQMVDEITRITAPGGKVIFVFPSVFYHPTLELVRFWCRPAGSKFVPTYKIISVSIKRNGQISDYQ